MSKITSILEKYNLIEKVDEEKSNDTIIKDENVEELFETSEYEVSVSKVEDTYCKQEIELSETASKEEYSEVNSNPKYDKKIMAKDIYALYGMENSSINTVFMLENLINALPQNLPQDVIKQSVMNIIDASQIQLDKLLLDGEQRLDILAKLIDGYYNETNNTIAEYKSEIAKLSSLIDNCQQQIKSKQTMLEEQTYIVKYETEKIDSIMKFFGK